MNRKETTLFLSHILERTKTKRLWKTLCKRSEH